MHNHAEYGTVRDGYTLVMLMGMSEQDKDFPITIRFKPRVVEALRALAREENRSLNGTVVEAVERYLRSRRRGQAKDAS